MEEYEGDGFEGQSWDSDYVPGTSDEEDSEGDEEEEQSRKEENNQARAYERMWRCIASEWMNDVYVSGQRK